MDLPVCSRCLMLILCETETICTAEGGALSCLTRCHLLSPVCYCASGGAFIAINVNKWGKQNNAMNHVLAI